MNKYQNDPIVDEIHKIREELAERYQFDPRLITEAAKKRQAEASFVLDAIDSATPHIEASHEEHSPNVQQICR